MNQPRIHRFTPIEAIEDIDLERHALIEASAGTGKTYTIENLVLRLLEEEPKLRLENILLVTFTEKATSELKQRIHAKIEGALASDHSLSEAQQRALQTALDNFDNAAIFTIHGFCNTLLQEFPFETGSLFDHDLIDDGPLMETLLREQMRSVWPRKYGDHLPMLLDLIDFSVNPDAFISRAVTLIRQLADDPSHETVIPDPASLDLSRLLQEIGDCIATLGELIGSPPHLVDGYARLNCHAGTRAAMIRSVIQPVEAIAVSMDADNIRLDEIRGLVDGLTARHTSGQTQLERMIPQKWNKGGENLSVCPNLLAIQTALTRLVARMDALKHLLMLESVQRLRRDTAAVKSQQGWISYHDMLARVAAFIGQPGARAGMRIIKNRYRVAFVDEFQDTDMLQWRIFRALFLDADPDAPQNRLFLIGDPKQAIYGFRGADVYTYLTARRQMLTLCEDGLANLYMLARNWRSLPELVAGFNQLFGQPAWFGPEAAGRAFSIGYTPAGSPPADQLPLAVVHDASDRAALNVVDLRQAGGHARAKALLAEFICREIRHLVDDGGVRFHDGDGPPRALCFGDVAVLVRSQGEFAVLEPLLEGWGIPYAYYRKPGLFQSPEAAYLSMVLHAVAAPQRTELVRRALLTPFFDIPAGALAAAPAIPVDHPSTRLIVNWHAAGLKRRWGVLFQSLMAASGMTLRHCTDSGWERTETNYRQLFDYLETAAYAKNLDLAGVVAHLDRLRRPDSAVGGDADIHQIEDQGEKVQILTMHVSKGLEFPVVFIAGGLTERGAGGLRIYHDVEDGPRPVCRKVIDLTDRSGAERFQQEYQDENKRLYYVALTRAKIKLYIPYFPSSGKQTWIGPVSRFVSPCLTHDLFPDTADRPNSVTWHDAAGMSISTSPEHFERLQDDRPPNQQLTDPPLPHDRDFRHRRVVLASFSSIVHQMQPATETAHRGFDLNDAGQRENDEPARMAASDPIDPANSLPGGAAMGSMFHDIFENIDFATVMHGPQDILSDPAAARIIHHAADLHQVDRFWLPQVAEMVAGVLRTPIDVGGSLLALGALTASQRRHEMEFFFPLRAAPSESAAVANCRFTEAGCRGMVLRGFIDLVFSWQGRYYIADWKSNRLADGYDQAAMAAEMESAGYTLQARLYTVATLRWLRYQLGPRFDPDAHFGGVLYLFLRGIKANAQDGVFHLSPASLLPLASLEASVQDTIAGGAR